MSAIIMLFLILLIGLCLGSFLNVLADRLPRGEDIFWGRSHCDYCKKTLRWYELVPVISYIAVGGKCMRCHKALSIQYPFVELVTGVGLVALFYFYGSLLPAPAGLLSFGALVGLFSILLVIFIADFKYQIIPDSMIVLGIVFSFLYIGASGDFGERMLNHAVAAVVSMLGFYLLWAVTGGRGMGFGDVKFAFLMGLFLGYPGVIVAFYIAFLTGAIVGVILMIAGQKKWKSKIAFGPFLVLGMMVAWVWKDYFASLWRMFL